MKTIILAIFSSVLILGLDVPASGQSSNDAVIKVTTPVEDVLNLKETEHDFLTIPQGKPVYYSFDIINTGKTPLKLDDVHASCASPADREVEGR